jgi:cytochrome c556
MLRLIAAGVSGVVLCAILFSGNASVGAANNADVPDTETIMKKLNKKKGQVGVHYLIQPMLESDSVPWDEFAKKSKEYAELTAALGKNVCPKGGSASWEKLCKAYAADAKALDAAVGKKDKAAATAAYEKLNKSCQACHDEHR